MRQIVKEAAEMYALQCISSPQLMEVCESIQEILESLEYAEEYGAQYDLYVEIQHRKQQQIERSWIELLNKKINWYAKYDNKAAEGWYQEYLIFAQDSADDAIRGKNYRYLYWTNTDYAEYSLVEKDIRRIAKEARKRNTIMRVILEFFKKYHLNECEIDHFWHYYHGSVE